jgi:hypothetical protein
MVDSTSWATTAQASQGTTPTFPHPTFQEFAVKSIVAFLAMTFALSLAQADEIDDFAAGEKEVKLYVTKDRKQFHSRTCPDCPADATPMDMADVLAQHPEMFPSACLDTPRFKTVATLYAHIMLESLEKKLSARTEVLRLMKEITPVDSKANETKLRAVYRSYLSSCQKLKLRYDDTALVGVLENGLPSKDKQESDATPKQAAAMKDYFNIAVKRGVRDTKLKQTEVTEHLLIFALTDLVDRDTRQITGLKNRYPKVN